MLRSPLLPAQYLPPLLPRLHLVSNVREGHATGSARAALYSGCCAMELRTRGAVPAWSSPPAILKTDSGERAERRLVSSCIGAAGIQTPPAPSNVARSADTLPDLALFTLGTASIAGTLTFG